ncbi:MAG: hypothetical protein ACRD4B_07470 [Acidobacteriota bacterium]
MLSAAHTIISLPLIFIFDTPVLLFMAAFVLHLLMDSVLHWNIYSENFKRYPFIWVALDVVGGLAASLLLIDDHFFTLPVWIAIAGGNMPDILTGLWDMLPPAIQKRNFSWLQPWFRFHDRLQLETSNMLVGLLPQVVMVGAAIVLIVIDSSL